MPALRYRVFFGADRRRYAAATQEQLDRIDQIVVEQEVDLAWEARLTMHVCLDEHGRWRHADEPVLGGFRRVRIELQVGDRAWQALIDGPIVQRDSAMDSRPGRSSVTAVIRDDSVWLNREEVSGPFPGRAPATDSARVQQLLSQFSDYVEPGTIRLPRDPSRVAVRQGTAIQFLRELAADNNCSAYVLPAVEKGGLSRFNFCPDPAPPARPTLPPLVLLGPGRNLSDVEVAYNFADASTTRARTLRIADGQVISAEASLGDVPTLRPDPAVRADLAALRTLPPEQHHPDVAESRAEAATQRRSYALTLEGHVLTPCYAAALEPYRTVELKPGADLSAGTAFVKRVVHTLTPGAYTQEFTLLANSISPVGGGGGAGASGLSLAFSSSLSLV